MATSDDPGLEGEIELTFSTYWSETQMRNARLILAVIALIFAVLSLVISSPLLMSIAIICLCVSVIAGDVA